jgi:hypothetical protein
MRRQPYEDLRKKHCEDRGKNKCKGPKVGTNMCLRKGWKFDMARF